MYNMMGGPGFDGGMWFAALAPFFLVILLWSLFWKGLALWHSARRGQYWWFLVMLLVNTAGILEIIYLFLIAKIRTQELFELKEHHHNH